MAPALTSDDRTPAAAPPWRLSLLGGFSLQRVLPDGSTRWVVLPGATPRRLLARLALFAHREHAREGLAELLWPGCAADVGRNRLRQALSALRAALDAPVLGEPVPWLQADRQALRLVPGLMSLDVLDFERCCDVGQHAAALAHYGGELLPGLYDDWIEEERRRLEQRAEHARAAHGGRLAQATLVDPAGADAPLGLSADTSSGHEVGAYAPEPKPVHSAGVTALPRYLARVFGLQAVLDQLTAAVHAARLVTITGTGGVGKTRLAVEFAQGIGRPLAGQPRFDHVGFVPWAACHHVTQAWEALGNALPGAWPASPAALGAQLAGQRLLLVLDCAEHLVSDVAVPLAELLQQAPQLHLVVTSRRPLGVAGERLVVLAPLPMPASDASPAAALANPAVAMLVDRARATLGRVAIGPADARHWVALARSLEGLPLAIELAALRLRSLSPAQLVQALAQGPAPRLTLLRQDQRDDRHAGLEHSVAWSWQGLSADAAALLAALTLFDAPFDAAAAAALAPAAPATAVRPPQLLLAELVDSSMLRVLPAAGASRELVTIAEGAGPDGAGQHAESVAAAGSPSYALDAPIREYGRQRLSEAAAAQARRALLAWALDWLAGRPRGVLLRDLRVTLPNLAAALAPEVVALAPGPAVQLWVALAPWLVDVACPPELLDHAEAAVAAAPDPAWRARGASALASPLQAAGRGQEALARAHAGALGPWFGPLDEAGAQRTLARMLWRVQRDGTAADLALDRAQAVIDAVALTSRDDAWHALQASTLALRAFIANVHHGDAARGERLHRQALALWLQLGDERAALGGRYNLAVCAERVGRLHEALELLSQVCAAATATDDLRHLSQALNLRGNILARQRRWAAAAEDYRASLRAALSGKYATELAYALWGLPAALAHLRQPEDAARLMAFAARHWQQRFGRLGSADLRDLQRLRRLVAVQCGAGALELLWAEGQGWDLTRALSRASGATESGTGR